MTTDIDFKLESELRYTHTTGRAAWIHNLQYQKHSYLKQHGLSRWEKHLWLFPEAMYKYLIDGMWFKTVNDAVIEFDKRMISIDTRGGLLPFGIYNIHNSPEKITTEPATEDRRIIRV